MWLLYNGFVEALNNWLIKNIKGILIGISIYFLITILYEEEIFGKAPKDLCPDSLNIYNDNFLTYNQENCFIKQGYYANLFQSDLPMLIISIVLLPVAFYNLWKIIVK